MVTADTVAITHLLVANVVFILGEFTRIFHGVTMSLRPGRDIVYGYLDYPVFKALEMFFNFCIAFFSRLPFIGFMGDWFKWFFIETEDRVFRMMHAEFVIVISSLVYGLVAYILARLVMKLLGVEED